MNPYFIVDHIGWITNNIESFEKFWCDTLGYKQTSSSYLTPEMGEFLFESGPANIKRYSKEYCPDIEIHQFEDNQPGNNNFHREGINHICICTGGPGTREILLNSLPSEVKTKIYKNPKGWENIFIRDFEGNWIELREKF